MAVINITIEESSTQVISGIPQSVSLTTSIPATIFYTTDGTEPTTDSSVYIGGSLTLPTNNSSVVLKLYATNGTDASPIITETYAPNITTVRKPHSTVIGLNPTEIALEDKFPFGGNSPNPNVTYGPPGGIVTDSPEVENQDLGGFDGTATDTHVGGTDLPLTDYKLQYSTTNYLGETGVGIGTLPGKVTIRVPNPTASRNVPSSSSKTSDNYFNPKAMVIYQDSRDPAPDNIPQQNRMNFSLSNIERSKNGSILFNNAFDSNMVSGSFIKQFYNAKDNTMTYYYRDNDTNQWIISKEPYTPKSDMGALYKMVFSSRAQGAGHVFKWIPFMYRKLI